MVVYGTRPEAIKVAPVIKALERDVVLSPFVVVTAQHREMLDQVNRVFGINPDVDLNLMSHGQSLNMIASAVIGRIDELINSIRPDAVIVQGDTTSVMGTAVAAFNRGVPVVHLEAGLRSGDIDSPFPEEANRRIVSQIARIHLAPTERSQANLVSIGVMESQIFVTGNTVIDALRSVLSRKVVSWPPELGRLNSTASRVLLVTTHRRENLGTKMVNIGRALRELATRNSDLVIVWPAHKNPKVRTLIAPELEGLANVITIEPVEYADFAQLLARSDIILTDSGGIQEEAPSLGKPVLVLRENTERPEGVDAGTVKLIGTDTDRIVLEVSRLLHDEEAYAVMANAVNPYGDGHSAERCVAAIHQMFEGPASQKK